MQAQDSIKPVFLDTDTSYELCKPDSSPYIKDFGWDINSNPALGIGTDNGLGEGQNMLVLTPVRSNIAIPNVILPEGYNKGIGAFYSEVTHETYCFNFNGNGHHGIYLINGDTFSWQTVIIDPQLNFSDDQEAYIKDHRVKLRTVTDKNDNIVEKFLIWTDGENWQGFINVIAAIKTNGFDSSQFAYWRLQQPHFDRKELLQLAVRPPMYRPEVETIPNTVADKGKINRMIDKSFQIAYDFINTDGRYTTFSPFSLPIIIKSEDFLNNPDNLPKNARVTLYAGSCMVEKIRIYVRQCGSDWFLYDTIYKYQSCNVSPNEILGTDYWLRNNTWSSFNYDPVFNTIQYIFDYSKVSEIIDQTNALRLQNDIPQLSIGMTDLGDSVAFGNNRYNYSNFGCDVTSNIDIQVKEKTSSICNIPLRDIYLYAYIGRCTDGFTYISQVGYYMGDDTQIRFGGIGWGSGFTLPGFSFDNGLESNTFDLNFGDKNAFICYLKGTPYYTVGKWQQVNSDNTFIELDNLLNINDDAIKDYIKGVFNNGGYFMCRFHLQVPAGRYIATLGRHNVNLSADWRNTSTYIMGIANSRNKESLDPFLLTSIHPNAIITQSKEIEVDCTAGNIDVWGNGQDLFYVYNPYITNQGNGHFRFIEGYLYESQNTPIPVELFPYTITENPDDTGTYTDKNGFYFGYTKAAAANLANIQFVAKLNCAYPTTFTYPTNTPGSGWRPNKPAYLSNFNNNTVGDCNRIIINGKITNLDGTIGFSGISITIRDGATAITRQDGTFELIVHNGQSTQRISNIYVNASGSYFISIADCGYIPLFNFNEGIVPCTNCNVRTYPIPLNLNINIQSFNQQSLKEGGKYSVACHGADLAGRLMFENVIKDVSVSTFLERNNLNPTYFQALINNLIDFSKYPDIKWFAFSVTKNINVLKYIQWVGDSIKYIDINGNVVSDPNIAVFVSIPIDSLYDYNISKNFTLISNYQFVKGDRLRILDNGDGQLFDTATYGDPIDVQILGTNYNQAAVNAGILPTTAVENPSQQTIQNNASITLLVNYDSRFDKLKDKTGFWIELYTPTQQTENVPYCEVTNFYPIINNKIVEFTGYDVNNQPLYNVLSTINLDFWDTYYFARTITIPKVGNKYFSHPFENMNISDNWGAGCTSCGRLNEKNENAKQQWIPLDVIKGDNFVLEGAVHGIGMFRSDNRKQFKESFSWGGIVAINTQGSIVMFLCENNWFITNFNFQYIFANAQGVQVANLDDKLSEPHQKIGSEYGVDFEDTSSILFYDRFAFWYDSKNEGYILSDYQSAKDISEFNAETSTQGFMKSFFISKTKFIKSWNQGVDKSKRFDVYTGIDMDRNNVYVSFRPRRNNTNDLSSYINNRRNWDLKHQETIVFNIPTGRWVRAVGFTPEGFATLKGNKSGVQLISFAAGKPWYHNSGNESYANYYGQQVTPCLIGIINKGADANKILQSLSIDSNPYCLWVDLIYSNFYNSYSYLSINQFRKKENLFYAAVLRNLNSYPSNQPEDLFRSNLFDGGRTYGLYFVCRFVMDMNNLNKYNEIKSLGYLFTSSGNLKK